MKCIVLICMFLSLCYININARTLGLSGNNVDEELNEIRTVPRNTKEMVFEKIDNDATIYTTAFYGTALADYILCIALPDPGAFATITDVSALARTFFCGKALMSATDLSTDVCRRFGLDCDRHNGWIWPMFLTATTFTVISQVCANSYAVTNTPHERTFAMIYKGFSDVFYLIANCSARSFIENNKSEYLGFSLVPTINTETVDLKLVINFK